LDCSCPLSSAGGGDFWGLQAGHSIPAQVPRRGGVRPLRPSEFCAVAGRERAFGPIRRAKWAKIGALWAAGGTARSRQDEPIERRPQEQGTQDAQKTLEGMRISAAMAIEPPLCEEMRLSPLWGALGWAKPSPGAAQRRRGGAQGGVRPPRPSDFWALAGWERASGPTRRAK